MVDRDDVGYGVVDHDAKYFRGMRIAIRLGLAALALVAIPGVRDWAWRTFQPGQYAAAHRKAADLAADRAAAKKQIDKVLATMRQCGDGSVVYDDSPCRDGSQGQPVMDQAGKR
jgi:hypothetical protein